jgi:hypothetical protein
VAGWLNLRHDFFALQHAHERSDLAERAAGCAAFDRIKA